MIENYKGWEIDFLWRDLNIRTSICEKSEVCSKEGMKWIGVNLMGQKIYAGSLKEIRHIIDYPDLYINNNNAF